MCYSHANTVKLSSTDVKLISQLRNSTNTIQTFFLFPNYAGVSNTTCHMMKYIKLTSFETHCKWLHHHPAHSECWRLALSVCSISGLEQAARVSVSPGGSSYLQPSAGPGNNTCIRLPRASHLTSLPHYNYQPCNPAGELSPAGNGCPGGALQGAQAGGKGETSALLSRKRALRLGMKMQILSFQRSVGCPSSRGVALQHSIFVLHLSAIITSSVITDRHVH